MLVSLEWLSEYIDITDLLSEQIAHSLTMSGLEVEEVEKKQIVFTDIVAAEILQIKPHPQADKLQLARISNGSSEKEVVCGASNIQVGQIVPYASVGSTVLDKSGQPFVLKPAVIRGVESQGMLCSAEELGLKTSDFQTEAGILILNNMAENITAGQHVKDILGLTEDIILHTSPTANRGDEMSVIGIAREISAIFNKRIKFPKLEKQVYEEPQDFKIEIKSPDACKYYSAGILKNVKIKPAPDWMKKRLLNSGVRSINNVVDITNYVMLEYGQPLHAFDIDKLGENYLSVRRAAKDEKILTLDETERVMNEETIVIATQKESVGLAGLMGGFNSEVDSNTRNIALESAYFMPQSTRKSARSVGLRTEASARFERGVDISSVKPSLIRAMELMKKYADAEIIGISEAGSDYYEEQEITLRFSQIKRVLGTEIPSGKCSEILENLGFETVGSNSFSAKFRVPSFRSGDVQREIDLIEEISRIHGYDKIETTLPIDTHPCEISNETLALDRIHSIMTSKGFREVVSSSLTGMPLIKWSGVDEYKECKDSEIIKITNPQSEEFSMLRTSMMPSILNIVRHNFDMGQKNLKIYETGKVFFHRTETDLKNTGTEEIRILAGAISGNIKNGIWKNHQEEAQGENFYTLKGIIDVILKEFRLHSRVEYEALKNVKYLHPGRAAEIKLISKTPIILGKFGQLHPETVEKCKFNQPIYVFEINLEILFSALSSLNFSTTKFKPLENYPAVARDIAFIIPQSVSFHEIRKTLKKAGSALYRKSDVFDLYQGEHVPQGCKSMAFRITLQDSNSTLTDEKIDNEIRIIREGLKKAYPEISFRE